MSTFNNSEFNNILFGELDLIPPPPFNEVYISALINGDSSVSFINESPVYITAELITGTSTVSAVPNHLVSAVANITGTTTITPNLGARYSVNTSITSGTTFAAENFLRARIDTNSYITATALVDYSLYAMISGESILSIDALTGDFTLVSDITGTSTVTNTITYFGSAQPADIIGESTVTAVTLFLFKRLENANIEGSSTVTVNSYRVIYLNARIDGSSEVTSKVTYMASLSANIETGTEFLKLIDVATDEILGNSYVTAELTAPQQFSNTGSRRRVTFVFEVDKPRSNVSIIDNHYKLFSFYNSLANVNQTLNYVRRSAGLELKNYRIDNATHRAWTGDADLFNLAVGDRGIVKKNATGMFTGKDGYFALYKGPLVVNNETEFVE
jgi:hypothetical protein